MKTSLLSTVLVLAVVIIVAIIAFIRVKKKGTCGCGKEEKHAEEIPEKSRDADERASCVNV